MLKLYKIQVITFLLFAFFFVFAGNISAQGFQSVTSFKDLNGSAITGDKSKSKGLDL